jgi:hypothetical protein
MIVLISSSVGTSFRFHFQNIEIHYLLKYSDVPQESTVITLLSELVMYAIYYVLL